MKTNITEKFEENYFAGYYKKMVGEFSPTDLERAKRWFWGWFRSLKAEIPLEGKGKDALEIGCSIGGAAAILADHGWKVYATDISAYALKRAEKLLPNINFVVWDITKPFSQKKKFDLVYGFEVIEHVEDIKTALFNIKKIIKPGGKFVFSTPFPYDYVFNDPTHVNVRHPKDWERIFKEIGFSEIKLKKMSFIPFFYRFSKFFHINIPMSVNSKYINSTLFIIGKNK